MYIHSIQPGCAYHFEFTNHRNEVAERRVIARSVQWGSTAWHTDLQWFLEAYDIDKQEPRSFPLANIRIASFARFTDEELDALLTRKTVGGANDGIERAAVRLEELVLASLVMDDAGAETVIEKVRELKA